MVVSLPSKSVRELFHTFFDILFSIRGNGSFCKRVISSFFLMKTLLSVIIYQSSINYQLTFFINLKILTLWEKQILMVSVNGPAALAV